MGLDIVEMFIKFEGEFELSIPDEIAGTLETPRHVIDFLMNTSEASQNEWSREIVADKVWHIIRDESGVRIERYNEDSYFVRDMGLD